MTQPQTIQQPGWQRSPSPTIGIPYATRYTLADGRVFLACPEQGCGDRFAAQAGYASHWETHHRPKPSPLQKVLDGFSEACALAWELADATEKDHSIAHEVLKGQAETLAEVVRALRSAMEESGLG